MTICADCDHARRDSQASSPSWGWKCAAFVPAGADLRRDRVTGEMVVAALPLCVDRNPGPHDCSAFAQRATTIDDFATIVTDDAGFLPNLDVAPLPFESFDRGLVSPMGRGWAFAVGAAVGAVAVGVGLAIASGVSP